MKTYVFFACLLSISTAVKAEETTELKDLTVTARPAGFQSLEHIAQPATVLAGDELKEKLNIGIGETLANELGVTSSSYGQGASRPIIRGLGGPRLRVLQDGTGSLDVSTISTDHNVALNPFNAEQIEILRGPATLLYGNGASAGIVNIVNNRIPETQEEFSSEMDIRYMSAFGSGSLGFKADGSVGALGLHFDTALFKSDDYEAESGHILNSAVDTDDINFGGSLIGDRGFIGLSYGRYTSLYEVPFNPEEPDELVFIDQKQKRFDMAGKLNQPLPGFRNINFHGTHNDYTHTEFEGPGIPGTVFVNDEWEGRIEANHKEIGPWSGTIGLQYRNRSFAAVGDEAFVPPTKQRSIGVFIFEDTDWENWHFEAGGRYEFQNVEPTATTGIGEIDHHTYSLATGAIVSLPADVSLGLNISRSQRAPALEELLASGPHLATETFETGDANLDAETSNNIDLGLERETQNGSWKVNLFANYIEDYIFQAFQDVNGDGIADEVDENGILGAGNLQSIQFKQNDAIFYGFEAETRLGLFENHLGKLEARLYGDLVQGKLSNGDDLPRISPARIGLNLDYERHRWNANLDLIHVFEQNNTAELEQGTGGYLMLNMGASYTLPITTMEGTLFIQGSNLLDQDARRHTSFIKDRAPLPGRSATAGLRIRY